MGFHEVRFPTNLSYGGTGGPGYNTNVTVTDSGGEERVPRWENAKRKYNAAYAIRHPRDLHAVYEFYIARMGPAYGFRYKDWLDYATTNSGNTHVQPPDYPGPEECSPTDMELGVGDGSLTRFQLKKQYSSGPTVKIRNITKPVAGTVRIGVNGQEVTAGWTVDTTTGVVLFTVPPAAGASLTWGGEFDVPVRFGKEIDEAIRAGLDDFGHGHVDDIPIVEIPDGLKVADDAYCGAAVEVCLESDYQLSAGFARVFVLEPRVGGLKAFLPDPEGIPPGGPMFILINEGPNPIAIETFNGIPVMSLAVGQALIASLTVDGGGGKRWYLV